MVFELIRKNSLLCLLGILVFITSCKQDPKQTTVSEPATKIKTPGFVADNAFANIEKQLAFGFRVPGTAAHREMQQWAISEFEALGAKVIKQDFKADFLGEKDVPCANIIAQFYPEKSKRVMLAAHYDSRMIAEKDDERKEEPIPGADDGGSGVGVLLEIGRIIKENPLGIGVDIVLFDAEDQGSSGSSASDWAIGSNYWSRNISPKGYRPKYGILLDMVGSENATFGKEEYSTQFAPALQNKIWKLAANMGYSDFFRDESYGRVYDDHFAVNRIAGIKMVDIINQDPTDKSSFGFYHHTHDDNIDVISKRTLQVVGQVVLAVLYNESNGTF